MKHMRLKAEHGFTLVEVIVVLVLMGILAVGLSMGLIQGVQNYIFASAASQLSQKAQLALARINKELIDATAITTASGNQVDYELTSSDGTKTQCSIVNVNGQILLISGGTRPVLIDNVNTGSTLFTYFQSDNTTAWTTANTFSQLAQIRVNIVLNYSPGQTLVFQTTINPRRNNPLNTPKLN